MTTLSTILGVLCLRRRRSNKKQAALPAAESTDAPKEVIEGEHQDFKQYLEPDSGESDRHEIDGRKVHAPELDGQDHHRYEICSGADETERQDAAEVGGGEIALDLEASTVVSHDRSRFVGTLGP